MARKPEPWPQETKSETKSEGTHYTPVKMKVKRLENVATPPSAKQKRCTGGQGRQPSPLQRQKQARIAEYFLKRSLKATFARERNP